MHCMSYFLTDPVTNGIVSMGLAQLSECLSPVQSFSFSVEALRNITKNVYLGFGSFVDKKTMPYVSVVPSQ